MIGCGEFLAVLMGVEGLEHFGLGFAPGARGGIRPLDETVRFLETAPRRQPLFGTDVLVLSARRAG